MKSTEAHSADQPRRAQTHFRRLKTFLAERNGFLDATREANPIPRRALRTVEADTGGFLVADGP